MSPSPIVNKSFAASIRWYNTTMLEYKEQGSPQVAQDFPNSFS